MNDRDDWMHGETFVWRYEVKPEAVDAFVAAYGQGGDWDLFFSGAPGYVRTEFYRDAGNRDVFVTIDYWSEMGQRDAYVSSKQAEFDALDAHCATLTITERRM